MVILAGDVGGTKVALALVEQGADGFRILREERYATEEFDSLVAVVERFLAGAGERPEGACFGVAAPIVDETVAMTNLDWEVDRERLARATGIPRVTVINDLAAAAWGIDALSPEGVETLSEGEPLGPTAGLVAAGRASAWRSSRGREGGTSSSRAKAATRHSLRATRRRKACSPSCAPAFPTT